MNHPVTLKAKIALACQLTAPDQVRRMNELHQTLFKKVTQLVEHATSYDLVFQKPDRGLYAELMEFIQFERLCCPWLKFQLVFEPGDGPVFLRLGNSPETREMVKLVMKLEQLAQQGTR
ncbi:hypothetical protein ACFPMF_01015 [Larkinella bovis]|uniref:Uncharacterized protein n=1 Tax=Larkinella bovis TaxID=683041 RepID=A0ABW0I4Y9_9BACT